MKILIALLLTIGIFGHAENDSKHLKEIKIKNLIDHVKDSLSKAENGNIVLPERILNLPGFSGHKVKHLLHYLANWENGCYLEIGCYYGSTLIPALYQNVTLADAIAIDNWSQFGGLKAEFLNYCANEIPISPLRFYEHDCFSISKKDIFNLPVTLYFYDGRHEYLDQKMAFTYFNDVFDDVFIALVDDWNWSQVRDGTYDAFNELKYKIHFSKEFFSADQEREHWWNGLLIAVIEKENN